MHRKKILSLVFTSGLMLSLLVITGLEVKKHFEIKSASNDVIMVSNEINDFPVEVTDNSRETIVYYMDDKNLIVPVMKEVQWPDDMSIAKETLKSLIISEDNNSMEVVGLSPVIPNGTVINKVDIKNGICYVDFNEALLRYNSKKEEQAMIQSIVYTLTEFPTIDKIKITINNKSNSLNYGFNISNPIDREDINFIGNDKQGNKMIVYYKSTVNGIDEYFLPVTTYTSNEVTMESAIETMAKVPEGENRVFSVLPSDINVKKITVTDGIAIVDLIDENGDIDIVYDKTDMQNAIAYTLNDNFGSEVSQVIITSNGERIFDSSYEEEIIPTFLNYSN